jgi:lipopolysaccharide/colanic/teichoic acid biosynthesis glycosyltransferase
MKRALDMCLSIIGLLLAAPLWIAIPIAIRL